MGMGMMGGPMTTMVTNNVDLVFLKQKLIHELSAYNINDDKDMIISIIRNSDYIRELRKSLHNPTIFQAGVQDFIDGIQDKILKYPEKWKTEFTQMENKSTLNELFYDMLKKYKTSVGEGGVMTSNDLYDLTQVSKGVEDCGSSPPPPHHSDKPKGPSMFSKMKDGTKNITHKLKEKLRKKTPEEIAAAKEADDKKKADKAAAALQKKADKETASAAKKAKQEQDVADRESRKQAGTLTAKDKLIIAGQGIKQNVSNAATNVKNSISNAAMGVGSAVMKTIETAKAQQVINKLSQRGGGGSGGDASHHRTRYISDIKNNRRRLYEREREMIQSIRNFENNNNINNNNNNNRNKSKHHKTKKLRNILMRR
jgi:hypothetical protein